MPKASKGKKAETIELSDEWRQDEPLAYLVKCFNTTMHEYMVFPDEHQADSFANQQQEESASAGEEEDWDIFPLYAGHPIP